MCPGARDFGSSDTYTTKGRQVDPLARCVADQIKAPQKVNEQTTSVMTLSKRQPAWLRTVARISQIDLDLRSPISG